MGLLWCSRCRSAPFEFLMKVDPYSYVTDLTALSHLDLIPEAVGLINAFSEKNIHGQKPFRTEIGTFKFSKVPKNFLLFGVENVAMGNIIYHYCNVEAFRAIIQNKTRKDNSNHCILCSKFYFSK